MINFPSEDCKGLRNFFGLSREDFAKLLGVKTMTIWRWEEEERKIKSNSNIILSVLKRIAINYQYDPQKILRIKDLITESINNGGLYYFLNKLLEEYAKK